MYIFIRLKCNCRYLERAKGTPMKYTIVLVLLTLHLSAVAQDFQTEPTLKEVDQLMNRFLYDQAIYRLMAMPDSTDGEVLQRKGYAFFRTGNYAKAIQQYRTLLRQDSTNANALLQMGQLYAKSNLYNEAYEQYQKLIALDSTNSYYYKQFAICAAQTNDQVTATVNLLKTVSLNQRDVEAYVLLGNTLIEMEQYPTADSVLTVALKYNRSPQLKLLLAKAFLGEEKYREVVGITEELMSKGDTIPAYSRLLGISYFQLDHFKKVIPFMNHLKNTGTQAEWIYYYLGVSYQQLNQPDSAIHYLNLALEKGISENISTYYTQLAMSYEGIKDFKKAIKYYKAAYESSKKDILLYHLARNYDEYYKDKTQAISYFKRYLSSDDTIKLAKEYTKHRLDQLQ
jgi:tetratricopeptide (TPR) repeat protein